MRTPEIDQRDRRSHAVQIVRRAAASFALLAAASCSHHDPFTDEFPLEDAPIPHRDSTAVTYPSCPPTAYSGGACSPVGEQCITNACAASGARLECVCPAGFWNCFSLTCDASVADDPTDASGSAPDVPLWSPPDVYYPPYDSGYPTSDVYYPPYDSYYPPYDAYVPPPDVATPICPGADGVMSGVTCPAFDEGLFCAGALVTDCDGTSRRLSCGCISGGWLCDTPRCLPGADAGDAPAG